MEEEVIQQEGWLLKRGEGYVDPDDYDTKSESGGTTLIGSTLGTSSTVDVGSSKKPRKKLSIFGQQYQLSSKAQSAVATAESVVALTKMKITELKSQGSAEKKRYFRLVTILPSGGNNISRSVRDDGATKSILRYYSKSKCDAASLKGTIELTEDTEVLMVPNDTVIKLITPGRTYYMRPEGDHLSALSRATAARWIQAIDTEIRRLYTYTSVTSLKNIPGLKNQNNPLLPKSNTIQTASSKGDGNFGNVKRPTNLLQPVLSTGYLSTQDDEDEVPATLEETLKDTKYRKLFHKFCETALASENMDFLDAIDVYNKIREPEKRNLQCTVILKTYIEVNSTKQVNISDEQRNQILKKAPKTSKEAPANGLFDDAIKEISRVLETNFFRRFHIEISKKTGAFAALFGLLGLDGWNAVVGHFGSVLTDQDRTLVSIRTRLQRVEAQLTSIEENLQQLQVPTTSEVQNITALRRVFASTNMRFGALSLYADEIRDSVIAPMEELTRKVQHDMDFVVRGISDQVNSLANIRKLLAAAMNRLNKAEAAMQAAGLKLTTDNSTLKRQQPQQATKTSEQLLRERQNLELGISTLSIEEEYQAALHEVQDFEKAQEKIEEDLSPAFEHALDQLESLELHRLETMKKLLRHVSIAEQDLLVNLRRIAEAISLAADKCDPIAECNAIGMQIAQRFEHGGNISIGQNI